MPEGLDRFRKLRWQSRRGMKELDVLFEAFFAQHAADIEKGRWPQLETLLAQEDDILFDWLSGRNLPEDPQITSLIDSLKNII